MWGYARKAVTGAVFAALVMAPVGTQAQSAQDDLNVGLTLDLPAPHLTFKMMQQPIATVSADWFTQDSSAIRTIYGTGCLTTGFDELDITISMDHPFPEIRNNFRYFLSDVTGDHHFSYDMKPRFWNEFGYYPRLVGVDHTGGPSTWRFHNRSNGGDLVETDEDCTGLVYSTPLDEYDGVFGQGNFFFVLDFRVPPSSETLPDTVYTDLTTLIAALGPGTHTLTDTVTYTFAPSLGN